MRPILGRRRLRLPSNIRQMASPVSGHCQVISRGLVYTSWLIHRVINAIAPTDAKERIAGLGVRVIEGEARFLDGKTIVVGPELDIKFQIKARRFVIATGSRPIAPTISGIEQVPYLTNENAFEIRERPKHLIVLGGSPIGMELAQAFRRLGSEVTVLDMGEPLGKEDSECAAI